MKYVYVAIAQFNGKNAGFVCFAMTKDSARDKTRGNQMSIKVKRVMVSPEVYEEIRKEERGRLVEKLALQLDPYGK